MKFSEDDEEENVSWCDLCLCLYPVVSCIVLHWLVLNSNKFFHINVKKIRTLSLNLTNLLARKTDNQEAEDKTRAVGRRQRLEYRTRQEKIRQDKTRGDKIRHTVRPPK